MKTSKLLAIISVFLFFNACTESKPKTDWEVKGLEGNVKSVTEKKYKAEEKFGEVVRIDTLLSVSTCFFNEYGFLTSEEVVNYESIAKEEGYKKTYEYNEQGLKIKKNEYDFNGELNKNITFEYDEKGVIIQESEYNSDGKLTEKSTYEEGLLDNQTYYDLEGEVIGKEVYKYNDEGFITENVIYNGEGTLTNMYTYAYEQWHKDHYHNWYLERLPSEKRKNGLLESIADLGSQSSMKKRFVTKQVFQTDSVDKQVATHYCVFDSRTGLLVELGKPNSYSSYLNTQPTEIEAYYYNDNGDTSTFSRWKYIEATYDKGLKYEGAYMGGNSKIIRDWHIRSFEYKYDKTGNWTKQALKKEDIRQQHTKYDYGGSHDLIDNLWKTQDYFIIEREIEYY